MPLRPSRRPGAIYIITLMVAALVASVGVCALLAGRAQLAQTDLVRQMQQARSAALSGVDTALLWASQDPAWRINYPRVVYTGQSGDTLRWATWRTLESGSFLAEASDPSDNSLRHYDFDPFRLRVSGKSGDALQRLTVLATPVVTPLPLLQTCLHAGAEVTLTSGKSLRVSGGALSTSGNLRLDGTLQGDAVAISRSGGGVVNGNLQIRANPVTLPPADLFDRLKANAQVLTRNSRIEKVVLGPGVNTFGGGVSPDGLYYMNTEGNDLTIESARVLGTLLVETGMSKKVTITKAVLMEASNPRLPTLIIRGNAAIELDSETASLVESSLGTNFNPAGAPYASVSNPTTNDTFPNELRGVVYVEGATEIRRTTRVRGTFVCAGAVTVDESPSITWDARYLASPPVGFGTITGHTLVPGTWRREIDP